MTRHDVTGIRIRRYSYREHLDPSGPAPRSASIEAVAVKSISDEVGHAMVLARHHGAP
jgi:hypothetical protein